MNRILVVLLIKQRVLLFLLAFLTSVQVTAQTTYGDLTVSKLLKVYDGDTIYVDIDEIHPLLGKNIGIKLQSVDAPEFDRRAKCDKEKEIAQEAHIGLIMTTKPIGIGALARLLSTIDDSALR
jgi:endonuclease YncB( thermonuclease family)